MNGEERIRRDDILFLAGVLLVISCVWIPSSSGPFLRHHENDAARMARLARNHVRFGYCVTRLGMLNTSGHDLSRYENWRLYYYTTRPPLFAFFVSLGFHLAGSTEQAYRLTLAFAAAVGLILFYLVALRLLPTRGSARLAVLLYATTCMFVYYSLLIAHLTFVVPLCLGALLAYLSWKDTARPSRLVLCAVILLVACLTDWPGYYMCLALGIVEFMTRQRRRWLAFGFILVGAIGFAIYVMHLWILEPTSQTYVRSIFGHATKRMQIPSGFWRYLYGEAREFAIYYGPLTVIVAVVGAAGLIKDPNPLRKWMILSLTLLGLDEIVFPFNSALDDFMSYPMLVFFSLATPTAVAQWRHAGQAKAIASVLLAAAFVQTLYVSHDRFTRKGALQYEYDMYQAIRKATPNDAPVVVACHVSINYDGYYLDRYGYKYEIPTQIIYREAHRGGWKLTPAQFVTWLKGSDVRFVVVALEGVTDVGSPFLAELLRSRPSSERKAILRQFDVLDSQHELICLLEANFKEKFTFEGFVFYRVQ